MTSKRQTPAMLIKKDLKKVFPWVKFSCKYDSFSWGDSVRIYWKGWPLTRAVNKIAIQYKDGYFDSMEDIYHHINDKPYWMTAKYIICNRENDPEQTEIFIGHAGYTKESLLSWLDELDDYDKIRSIASIVRRKMDNLTNNKWENYSDDVSNDNKEIWDIVSRYVVYGC